MENKEINLLTTLKKQEYGSNSNAESCIGRKTAGIEPVGYQQGTTDGGRQTAGSHGPAEEAVARHVVEFDKIIICSHGLSCFGREVPSRIFS